MTIHVHVHRTRDAMTKSALQGLVGQRFDEFERAIAAESDMSQAQRATARREFSSALEQAIKGVSLYAYLEG